MRVRQAHRHCKCNSRLLLLSGPLLLLSLILPISSYAQLTSNGGPSTNPLSPSTSIPTSFSTRLPSLFITTSIVRLQSHPASSIPTAAATSTSSDSDVVEDRKSSILNYYFVFLAFFGLLLCLGVFFLHRRKKRQKERYRNSGQNALARDLDGWVNSRRWVHGNWRSGRSGTGGVFRREEGLNEHGEAPPPYQPKGENDGERSQDPASALAVPLRTLSREGREGRPMPKPPDYQETIHTISVDGSTRPNTTEHPDSSTRDLLKDSETAGQSSR